MEEIQEASVYNLITSLCEKFSTTENTLNKLKSISYSILLGKHPNRPETDFRDSEWPDALSNLLAWQYTLSTEYGLSEHAKEIKEFGEYVQNSYGDNIIHFLMCLRKVPIENDEFTELDLSESLRNLYTNELMVGLETNSSSTALLPQPSELKEECSVWELALKEKYSERRNWESFGLPEPDKEKYFLSELGDDSHLWVENLRSVYITSSRHEKMVVKPKVRSVPDFVEDVKYLMVGLASEMFSYDCNGNFILLPHATVVGITPSTLKIFSEEFIFCGACYKALNQMSLPNTYTAGEYKQVGYIFAEFCESLQRYLEYYRTAIISISNSYGLLKLKEHTNQLRSHLKTLAEICKVGPYVDLDSGKIPHGVELLNYLYETVLNLTDQNTLMVLYAILFPCCQVYYNRFLQQWLLDGIINDPHDEFFIKPNCKYISTRGRTYWTRSYSIREDIVPAFLVDLRLDILRCGRNMNLLKMSSQSSKLCSYLMGKKPLIISCCLTAEQLVIIEQNATTYYLEVLTECGPLINLEQIIRKGKEVDLNFLHLVAKKRAVTLERLELERKKMLEEQKEKKLDEIAALKEQYDSALQLKQKRIASEIENEIKLIEFKISVDNMRDKLIEEEAKTMITYYQDLYEISEQRKKKIDKHIELLKSTHIEPESSLESTKSSRESFHSASAEEIHQQSVNTAEIQEDEPKMHSSKSLDIINANEKSPDKTISTCRETFEMARKIREKVLKEELDLIITPSTQQVAPVIKKNVTAQLSEAQKNKLRVLSSEFGIDLRAPVKVDPKRIISQAEINRNVMQSSNEVFLGDYKKVDYGNFANNKDADKLKMKKSFSLFLDDKSDKSDYPVPMSVDSTPLSDSVTSRTCFSAENLESVPTTAGTHITDDGEGFTFKQPQVNVPFSGNYADKVFSKRVTAEEASGLSANCLKLFLHKSIEIPLATQKTLADNEILKYFIQDLDYFKHLTSLRMYFFLQDGEFGRNITENLFEKLYEAQFPVELVNFRTLRDLVFGASEMSSKFQQHASCLSFKINSLPKMFHLGDPDVLDCLSLTYKVPWPLNILLPVDTIAKYDEVFKYLLKLNRISWVLKRIFLELKVLAKISGKKEIYLMASPHYRRLHQCRHVMMHFIQTLRNYVVGEVLQTSWVLFEKNLKNVSTLDDLYLCHTTYIKNILLLSMLNQKSAPLRKVVQKIFVVILKFYDYLRSDNWVCRDGMYVHPNFEKLESIFLNFEEFVLYLFKMGKKVAKSGYQPHLTELLDMMDCNCYYSNRKSTTTVSTNS